MEKVLALLFVAAVVGIFKPYIANLKRWHFAVVSAVLFVAFGASIPKKNDGTVQANGGGTQAAQLSPAASGERTVDKVALVKAFQSELMDGMKPCDAATSALAGVAGKIGKGQGSVYDGYSAASRAEEACRQSWSTLSKVKAPEQLSDSGHEKAEKTIETCADAALSKKMAASQMGEIFDGDMRPSMVEEAKQKAEMAQAGVLACVAGIFDFASTEGVDLSKLESGKK